MAKGTVMAVLVVLAVRLSWLSFLAVREGTIGEMVKTVLIVLAVREGTIESM